MLTSYRKRLSASEGFSLVELLVVITILGIVSGVVLSATVSGLEASRKAQARVEALSDLTRGLERIGRELRAADPLLFDDITDVDDLAKEVGAQIVRGAQVWQYRYYLTTTADGIPELREDIDIYDLAGALQETRDGQFIVNTVNADVGVPLVTYLDDEGTVLDCTSLTLDACKTLLATAAQIRLTLVRSLPEQNNVTVSTTVNIRQTRWN